MDNRDKFYSVLRKRNFILTFACCMKILRIIIIAFVALLLPTNILAEEQSDSIKVSLLTCYPGEEVYELYGHTALRVRGENFDSVWNYGLFDFAEPNFVGRFVKGDTYYYTGGYPTEWFLVGYRDAGRKVMEQELRLSPIQSRKVLDALHKACLPENSRYKYDYVKDNCATRPAAVLYSVLGDSISVPEDGRYGSYRKAMKNFHSHYPWYALGIDIALGAPIDTLISGNDENFLPLELMRHIDEAKYADGRSLVANKTLLVEGEDDATLPPTPWYLTPLFIFWALFVITILACYKWYGNQIFIRLYSSIFFGVVGIFGVVLAYLVFISSHEAASPNMLLAWFNPLALIVPICIWWRATRPLVTAYMVANIIALITMCIIWNFQPQTGNAAFIPLLLIDLSLSIVNLINYQQRRL